MTIETIERICGQAHGRCAATAYNGMVYAVGTDLAGDDLIEVVVTAVQLKPGSAA